MKKTLLFLFAFSFNFFISEAQNVGIGTNAPSDGAKLDIESTDKGILIPRVSLVAKNDTAPIVGPLEISLLVYNDASSGIAPNDVSPGFYYWNGTAWERITNSSDKLNATNGLSENATDIKLGGPLTEATTITQGINPLNFNLNSTGDFNIQDNGTTHFTVQDNGNSIFGGDVEWRDENTSGTILAQLIDDGNDGRFIIRENGGVSIDLDANTQFIFNEQGFDRDFRIESDGNANIFRVNAGTNKIGIGDANPTTSLEITAPDGQTLMLSRQDGEITANEQLGGIGFDGSDGNTPDDIREASASIIAFASETHGTGDKGGRLTFWTSPTNQDDDTDGLERLRIDQNGTHYIGGDMYWRDASVTGTNLAQIIDDGNDGRFIIHENGVASIDLDANTQFIFNEQGFDRNFRVESDADAFMFFLDAGTNRIGIRKAAPLSDLHLKMSASPFPNPTTGGITMENSANSNEWQFWNSNPYLSFAYNNTRVAYINNVSGAWVTTSDKRWKKDIEPLKNVLNKVLKLNTVEYRYLHNEENSAKTIGFIAQDVQELFPNLVYTEDGTQLALSSADFGVLSIKAIQEQQKIIEELQRQIDELKLLIK